MKPTNYQLFRHTSFVKKIRGARQEGLETECFLLVVPILLSMCMLTKISNSERNAFSFLHHSPNTKIYSAERSYHVRPSQKRHVTFLFHLHIALFLLVWYSVTFTYPSHCQTFSGTFLLHFSSIYTSIPSSFTGFTPASPSLCK